jgi:hypothetical protein
MHTLEVNFDKLVARFLRTGRSVLNEAGKRIVGIPTMRCAEPKYPPKSVVLEVPGVCQVSTYTCGITASWSIIAALGSRVTLKKWYKRCHNVGCHPDEGMDIDQIESALSSLQLRVYTKRFRGRKQIKNYIDKGQPILFGAGRETFRDGDHWMYAYGYSGRYIFVGNVINPLASKQRWSWGLFESELTPKRFYIINT